jgi:hypothetical protein
MRGLAVFANIPEPKSGSRAGATGGRAATGREDASSSNATAKRRAVGSSTASSLWPSSQILHEAMPGDHDPGAAVLLEPAHRTQPRLQPAMVTLDVVVGIPIGAMPDRRQQLLEHRRVHRRMVGDDLNGRDLGRADGPLEEAAGSPPVMLGGDKDIDDLAELVDGARSASSSSTSRKDRPKRRYQRTASTITSGGKQKPAKADRGAGTGCGRRVS